MADSAAPEVRPAGEAPNKGGSFLTLYTHAGDPVAYPRPKGRTSFNESHGDGVSWAKWTHNVITGCLHGCEYCLAPETPVLMSDMTWRPIGEIHPGEQVIAFDEEPPEHLERRWRIAEVTRAWRTVQAAYRIVFDDGRQVVASSEHRWLCDRQEWRTTSGLRPGHRVRAVFAGGAGLASKGAVLEGNKVRTGTATVVSVTRSLDVEMVDITTSTGTFVADGLLTHNCYAREIATGKRFASRYPAGFVPVFHPERLDAALHTSIPRAHRGDPAWYRVFEGSMADNYGRWVPDEWIQQIHAAMLAGPAWWQYVTLTKFPGRYVGLDMPPGAWIGTSVDEQKRVRIAEEAFRQIPAEGRVRWLSLEPLREPLKFTDMSNFDWVVIGAQTATRQPGGSVPAFAPPFDWVARITAQAREAGAKVHLKPNLLGKTNPQSPGMQLPDEYPDAYFRPVTA